MTERYQVQTTQPNLFGRALTFVALDDDEDTFVVDFDWTGVGSIEGDDAIDAGDAAVIAANDPERTMFRTTAIPDAESEEELVADPEEEDDENPEEEVVAEIVTDSPPTVAPKPKPPVRKPRTKPAPKAATPTKPKPKGA